VDLVDVSADDLFPANGASFNVSATVRLGGTLVGSFLQTALGAQNFTVTFYYESFGGGPEGTLGAVAGNTNIGHAPSAPPCTGACDYVLTASVTAPGAAGTYKITAVMTSTFPMAAYGDGPLINVT
jgi:hypothetical protein